MIPEDSSHNVVLFNTNKMKWELKSSNNSGNISTSVVFQLASYDGEELGPSSNIEITVNL